MKDAAPLVSVVIPVYNAGPYIEATVRSVLAQTYPNIEIIAVNDGSRDNSLAVLQELAVSDGRIQVVDIPNQGVSVARNTGIATARGAFVALLDADDLLAPECIELKVEALQAHPEAGLSHGDIELVDAKGQSLGTVLQGQEGQLFSIYAAYQTAPVPGACSNVVLRKSLLDKIGGFHPKLSTAADREFMMRATLHSPVVRVPKVLSYYRMHGTNMHRNIALLDHDENLIIRLLDDIPGAFASQAQRNQYAAKIYWMLAGSWIRHKRQYRKGLTYLARAIATRPSILLTLVRKFLAR